MRHGVPLVATGGKEDKPEVGARVARSGVGRRLRTGARIATDMAAAPGFAGVAAIVDDVVKQSRCTPIAPN